MITLSIISHQMKPRPLIVVNVLLSSRTTVLAAVAFLDAFQKVADMATNTRGRTTDCLLLVVSKNVNIHFEL